MLVCNGFSGHVPFPLERLTPHSLSRRFRDFLAGDLGAHRTYPVDPNEDTEPEVPTSVPAVERKKQQGGLPAGVGAAGRRSP